MKIGIYLTVSVVLFLRTSNSIHNETYIGNFMHAWCDMRRNNATGFQSTQNASGVIHVKQPNDGGIVDITIDMTGFDPMWPGHLYEFHVHEFGDLSNGCQSTGDYFNPFDSWMTHIGDWGSVPIDDYGGLSARFQEVQSSLLGYYSIIGRSVVVHERIIPDVNDNITNWETVDHRRLACCVIHPS